MNGIRSELYLRSDSRLRRQSDGQTLWRASRPFVLFGGAAIIAGGLVATAVAHQPVRPLVWMSAYLVLIVGVVQIVVGAGQAWLLPRSLNPR